MSNPFSRRPASDGGRSAGMQIIDSIHEMQSQAVGLRSKGRMLALVPTMGSLHEGHLSLVRMAREKADTVVVSIFVNPTQFGPSEDFDNYPRELEKDLDKLREEGVDIAFTPKMDQIYPKGYSTYIDEETIAKDLCGVSRPGHFRGVTTVVAKLFNICRPDVAIFGQKDAQQCAVIKKMVDDLNFSVEIVAAPTIREADGMAMSSRNRYLTPPQREEALKVYRSLCEAKRMVTEGVTQVDRLIAEVTHILTSSGRRVRVIYIQTVDKDTFEPVRNVTTGKTLLAIAVWVDEVRLIDNMVL